jgi:hypothetical protein
VRPIHLILPFFGFGLPAVEICGQYLVHSGAGVFQAFRQFRFDEIHMRDDGTNRAEAAERRTACALVITCSPRI